VDGPIDLRSAGAGARWFGRLARWIVRHPWYPVVFWVALLVVTVPFLPLLGSVTTNSQETTAASSPSSAAAARLAELFPNATGGSESYLLLYGPDLTDAHAQAVTQAVTAAIAGDRSLAEIAGVDSVYTDYSAYLAGQARIAGGVLAPALAGLPSLPTAANGSLALLWGPPAMYLATWEGLVPNATHTPYGWEPTAYNRTAANLSGPALSVLAAFYGAFHADATCAQLPGPLAIASCADNATRAGVAPLLGTLFPGPEAALGNASLAVGDVGNFTTGPTLRWTVAGTLAAESGLRASWVRLVWEEFPTGTVGPGPAARFANATVANHTLSTEPLPVPPALYGQFVNRAGTATLIDVSFAVADDYTNASGGSPVYADLPRINSLVAGTLRTADPGGSIAFAQTGPAPLDQLTQQAVNSSLSLVLPLTVGLLLVISMAYFRSPLTPLVTFAGLAIALVLGLGATVVVGTLVEHIDSSALTLEEVFVLGVGTDYSIFLVARYREELVHGATSHEAVVTSMQWAGQSVATSGSTAILVTAALAASGVALLANWGLVLSVAILITMLLSLTLVPAALVLIGPRIFWPTSGERFRKRAEVVAERVRLQRTYFYRAGHLSERHAGRIVGAVVAVSIPLIAIALTVPISYDFYGQLPNGHYATNGLADLNAQFGAGFATPSYALVTFAAPLRTGNVTNTTDFVALADLTALANSTAGIAAVGSPIGPGSASLANWLALPTLPPAVRTNLLAELSGYVGTDGRTVLVSLQTSATGLSQSAVAALSSVESAWSGYAADHPGIDAIAYGGAAPVIHDLATETDVATEYMILAVAIGLVAVLVVVLRSWIIALLAVGTIGLSIGWAWALTYLLLDRWLGFPLFFYVRTILFMLVLGLGIDYNIFLLTRVREERLRGRDSGAAATEAVARTGGIITAAAVILACAFAALIVAEFTLIRAIGFAVAIAVVLDAMVVRTYLVPATLHYLGDRVWKIPGRRAPPTAASPASEAGGIPRPAGEPTTTRGT